jgi:hypothetical protein
VLVCDAFIHQPQVYENVCWLGYTETGSKSYALFDPISLDYVHAWS